MELEFDLHRRHYRNSEFLTLMLQQASQEAGASPPTQDDEVTPRLHLSRGQKALGVLLVLLLLSLLASAIVASADQQRHTENFVRTEATNTNTLYTLRETQNYSLAVQQYLLGYEPRRTAQLARALLGQRLDVVDGSGQRAGDAAGSDYVTKLKALDEALAQAPAGIIPAEQRARWASLMVPRVDDLSSETRRLADRTSADFRNQSRASDEELLRGRLVQLVLLLLSLAVGAILLVWVAADVLRRYRRAREVLDEDERELQQTRAQLDRVSALERGQARILERIATATPLASIFQSIAALAFECTNGLPARVVAGSRTMLHPVTTTRDPSAPLAWSGTFDTEQSEGTVEVLGSPSDLDDFGEVALSRCLDLARLAVERDASARKLSHQASHDALTGLANRSLLLSRLNEQIQLRNGTDTELALLFCDLDRFKMVNDSIGHAGGDLLLIEAARRLLSTVRDSDTVARLGGDEFVVLCPTLTDRSQAWALAERVRAALSAPYQIEGKEAFVGASIGITFADASTTSGADLMREADVAMYRAKMLDGSHVNAFDSHMEAEVAQRLDLDTALRRAIERNELQLDVQPVVMMETGRITGFEALIRWKRSDSDILGPDEFIPLAEDNGLIVEIGRWVLHRAIQTLAEWRASGVAGGISMSVNVSARQVREAGFADEVLATLRENDVPAASLVIELTEHALVDLRTAHAVLAQLRASGIRVSLDDFGTGYSSLTQLRTLPVDQVKLDRSFAAALDEGSTKQRAVVASVVSLTSALSLDLVVEGVETVLERDQLLETGVRRGQGYLFGRPMSAAEGQELLAAQLATT